MSDDSKEIIRLLRELNANVQMLSKMTALSLRKATPSKEPKKETKQDQIKVLDELNLSDNIIALIIDSTPGSVQNARSLIKAKKEPKPSQISTQEAKG